MAKRVDWMLILQENTIASVAGEHGLSLSSRDAFDPPAIFRLDPGACMRIESDELAVAVLLCENGILLRLHPEDHVGVHWPTDQMLCCSGRDLVAKDNVRVDFLFMRFKLRPI